MGTSNLVVENRILRGSISVFFVLLLFPSISRPSNALRAKYPEREIHKRTGLALRRLLATVGPGSRLSDDYAQHRTDAMCSSGRPQSTGEQHDHSHAMCDGSATCRQWEGLSCREVDSVIQHVQKYNRVYSSGNLNGQEQGILSRPPSSSGLGMRQRHSLAQAQSQKQRGLPTLPTQAEPTQDVQNAAPYVPLGFSPMRPSEQTIKSSSQGKDKPASFPWKDKDGHIAYKLGDGLEPGQLQPRGRYKILRSLGSGTYGKVVECWDRQAGAYCAVKVVRAVPKYRHAAKTEVSVLEDLQGEHRCVKMLRSFDYRGHICLVFELLGPNLYEMMRANSFKPFGVSEIRSLSSQVLEALCHAHTKGVIHTDVKPENILFQEQLHKRSPQVLNKSGMVLTPRDTQVKLVDFGSGVYNHSRHSSVVSTRHYRAPEIILRLGWSFPCDIWSMGCILYEMYTGEVLFPVLDEPFHLAMMEQKLKQFPQKMLAHTTEWKDLNIVRTKADPDNPGFHKFFLFWRDSVPENKASVRVVDDAKPLHIDIRDQDLLDLVGCMLELDPEQRITAADALLHPFFTRQRVPGT